VSQQQNLSLVSSTHQNEAAVAQTDLEVTAPGASLNVGGPLSRANACVTDTAYLPLSRVTTRITLPMSIEQPALTSLEESQASSLVSLFASELASWCGDDRLAEVQDISINEPMTPVAYGRPLTPDEFPWEVPGWETQNDGHAYASDSDSDHLPSLSEMWDRPDDTDTTSVSGHSDLTVEEVDAQSYSSSNPHWLYAMEDLRDHDSRVFFPNTFSEDEMMISYGAKAALFLSRFDLSEIELYFGEFLPRIASSFPHRNASDISLLTLVAVACRLASHVAHQVITWRPFIPYHVTRPIPFDFGHMSFRESDVAFDYCLRLESAMIRKLRVPLRYFDFAIGMNFLKACLRQDHEYAQVANQFMELRQKAVAQGLAYEEMPDFFPAPSVHSFNPLVGPDETPYSMMRSRIEANFVQAQGDVEETKSAPRQFERFSKYRLLEDHGQYDIYDVESYGDKVEGLNKYGKGRPQLPRGVTISPTMMAYHQRELKKYDREKMRMHFEKVFPVYLRHYKSRRLDRDTSGHEEAKIKKELWKQFKRSKRVDPQALFNINFGCKRRASRMPHPTIDVNLGISPEDLGKDFGKGLAAGLMEKLKASCERHFGPNTSGMVKLALKGVTMFLTLTDPNIQWAMKASILTSLLGMENTAFQVLHGIFLGKVIKDRYADRREVQVSLEPEIVEAQAAEDDESVAAALFSIFPRLLGWAEPMNIPGTKIAKFLALWGNAAKGLEHLVTFVWKGIKWTVNLIYEKFYGVPWLPTQCADMYERVKSWNDYLTSAELKERLGEATTNAYRVFLVNYREKFEPLHKSISTVNEPAIKTFWSAVERRTMAIYQRANESVKGVGKRPVPVAALFCGSTAQGKSTILQPLCCLLARKLGVDYERAGELIYPRNRTENYWSGYKDQMFVAIDEFLSADSAEATQKVCDDFISIVNIFDYILPMAAVEEKGKAFTSPFVFATSNIGRDAQSVMGLPPKSFPGPNSVGQAMFAPEAVYGRFGRHVYRVVQTEKISLETIEDPAELARKALTAWRFDRYSYVIDGGKKVTFIFEESYNFVQVAKRLMEDHKLRQDSIGKALCDQSTLAELEQYWDDIHPIGVRPPLIAEVPEDDLGINDVQGLWSDFVEWASGTRGMQNAIRDQIRVSQSLGVNFPGVRNFVSDEDWLLEVRTRLLTDIPHFRIRERLAAYEGDAYLVLGDLRHLVELERRNAGDNDTLERNTRLDLEFIYKCASEYINAIGYRAFVGNLLQKVNRVVAALDSAAAAAIGGTMNFLHQNPFVVEMSLYVVALVIWIKFLDWMFPPVPIKFVIESIEQQGFGGMYQGKQAEDRRNQQSRNEYVPKKHKGRLAAPARVDAQSSTAVDTDQDPSGRNIVEIAINVPEGRNMRVHALFVAGNTLMAPAHLWNPVLEHGPQGAQPDYPAWSSATLSLRGSFGSFQCSLNELDPRRLWLCDEQDVSFIDLTALKAAHTKDWNFQTPPTIKGRFVTEADITKNLNYIGGVALLKPSPDWGTMNKFIATSHMIKNVNAPEVTYKVGEAIYAPPILEIHGLCTRTGECGLPYVALEGPRRLIGFHVARKGENAITYASIITAELINQALSDLGTLHTDITGKAGEIVGQGASMIREVLMPFYPRVRILGEVPSPGGGGDTKLIKTRLHPSNNPESERLLGPSLMAPARLTRFVNEEGELISPMLRAVATFAPRPSNLTYEEVEYAARGLHLQFPPLRHLGVRPMILTLEQAIVGVPFNRYLRSVELHTACGYTYNTVYKNFGNPNRKGKRRFFDIKENPTGNTVEYVRDSNGNSPFLIEYGKLAARYLQGLPGYIPNVGTLKDEKRKLKKVAAGDSRLFSVSEMHAQIIMKQFFGSLMACVAANRNDSEPKIGTNPYSSDWEALYRKMTRFAKRFFGDYTQFDKSHQEFMMMGAFLVFRAWFETYAIHDEFFIQSLERVIEELTIYAQAYLPKNWDELKGSIFDQFWNVFKAIFYDSCYCIHVLYGLLVLIIGALPSGHALTTLINCIINMLIFRVSFYRKFRPWEKSLTFEDHVEIAVVGDDNGACVDDECAEFNCESMEAICAEIGYVYTDYAKSGVTRPFHDIGEVEFNKRRFDVRDDRIWAPLNWDTLREVLYWRHKDLPEDVALRETMRSFFIELYQYPREFYERCRNAVIVLLQESCPTYFSDLRTYAPTFDAVRRELEQSNYAPRMWGTRPIIPCLREAVGGETQQVSPTAQDDNQKVETLTVEAQGSFSRITQGLAMSNETVTNENTTTFHDDGSMHVIDAQVIPRSLQDIDPFPHQDMSHVLGRTYQIDTISWSSSQASGTVIGCYLFPNCLFAQKNIWDKLARYDLLDGGVEIEMRINATPLHYGAIIASTLPHYDPTDVSYASSSELVSKFGDLYAQAQNPSFVLSASSGNTLKFTIPKRRPNPWIHIDRYVSNIQNKGSMGCVVIRVLAPLGLVSSITSPTVDITVFARFLEPRVAGLQNEDRAAYSGTVNQYAAVVAQGRMSRRRPTVEEEEKSSEHLLSGTATSIGKFLGGISQWPVVGSAAGVASKAFTFLGAGARSIGLDKPTTIEAPTLITPRLASDLALVRGLDLSSKLSLDPDCKITSDPSLIKLTDDETSIRGFSKRLFLVDVCSFDGSSAVGTRVCNIPVTPQLCHASVVSGGYKYRPTPPAYTGLFHRHWRGSMKYSIMFFCSGFSTWRARIAHHPDPAAVPTTLATGMGDTFNMVVDGNGDQVVEFTVPYLGPGLWKHANYLVAYNNGSTPMTVPDSFANGMLTISIVNPVRTSENTNNSTVTVAVFQTVGPDFQFAVPCPPVNMGTDVSDVVAQGSTETPTRGSLLNVGDFPGIVPSHLSEDSGICMGECVDDIRDLVKRYCYRKTVNLTAGTWAAASDQGSAFYSPITQTLKNSSAIGMLAAMYLFVRGSYRNKFIAESGETIAATLYNQQEGFSFYNLPAYTYRMGWPGSALALRSHAGEISVEIPYYVPWAAEIPKPCLSGTASSLYMGQRGVAISAPVANATVHCFEAFGDDVDFGCLCSPPGLWAAAATLPGVVPGVYPY